MRAVMSARAMLAAVLAGALFVFFAGWWVDQESGWKRYPERCHVSTAERAALRWQWLAADGDNLVRPGCEKTLFGL